MIIIMTCTHFDYCNVLWRFDNSASDAINYGVSITFPINKKSNRLLNDLTVSINRLNFFNQHQP